MLIWTSITFTILFTIGLSSNHPLKDDSDPEIVEARRTQVLSRSVQHFHHQNQDSEDEIENGKVGYEEGESSTRGQTRGKKTFQSIIEERKDDFEGEETEENEREKVLSQENISRSRSKVSRTRSKSEEDQFDEESDEDKLSKSSDKASNESKTNKTIDNIKDKNDEVNPEVSSSSQLQQKQKTVNDSHRNYTRLEPVRGRKSSSSASSGSSGSSSSTPSLSFRRQRTPSHVQTDVTPETTDIFSESVQNPKKRRRLLTTSTSTTPTPQTMPYNLYNHFRPLDQDVPQDHLLPFLDFGKKLSPGIPPTPGGINSIENKSINQRYRSKEHVTPEYRSTQLDEDVLLHEDMDVTVQKKTIERNNVPRVKIQQLRDPFISGYYRRRPSTTVQPDLSPKTSENSVVTTTECINKQTNDSDNMKINHESEFSGSGLNYKHISRTIMKNDTKCEYPDNGNEEEVIPTTIKYNKNNKLLSQDRMQINDKQLVRSMSNNGSGTNNDKIVDVESINGSSSRLQKFEQMKMEPSLSLVPLSVETTTNIVSTTKRILPVKLLLRNRNLTTTASNETAIMNKNIEELKSATDPLVHEESNNYEKTANSTQKIPPKQIITTISPSNQQLTTRILSTAVVTSVSVKESLSKNDNTSLNNNETLNGASNLTSEIVSEGRQIKISNNEERSNRNKNNSKENSRKESSFIGNLNPPNKTTDYTDSTGSGSSTKMIIKPTESSMLFNRSIPEDFIEVPRIATKYPRPTTISSVSTENNSRKEFNKTYITNNLYKPKIILPRTKIIVSSTTPKISTIIPLSKITRVPTIRTKTNFDEKISSKETLPTIQPSPAKLHTRSSTANTQEFKSTTRDYSSTNSTKFATNSTFSSVTIPTATEPSILLSSINNGFDSKNLINLSTIIPNVYEVTDSNLRINNTAYVDSKQSDNVDESKIGVEEIIPQEKILIVGSSRKSNPDHQDSVSLHGESAKNWQEEDGSYPSKSRIEPSGESNTDNDGISEPDKQETILEVITESTTSISNKTPLDELTTTNNFLRTSTTAATQSATRLPLSTTVSALDHKWLHSTAVKPYHNMSITDGQHTDVGVAYPEGVHVATYVLTGLGVIPVLLLAVIVARVFILRNRKKVLDESEYSSEYNRSPLGTTSSPLPTKLPRVPAHLGWEVEKNPPLPPIPVTSTRWEFPRDKLRLQTVLGQGNFGQVWKAEADDISGHEGLTRLVAVKTVKEGASNREREDLLRELGIMQELGAHPNVVTLLGCCTEKEPYLLIMEYVMYGKLLAFLRDHRTRAHYYNFSESTDALTSRDLTVFAYCVARGMDYLTTKGIIHRDIAARNVLVDHNKLCKIADFGMSRNVRDTGQIYEQRQSKGALPIRWMAPESLHFSLFTHKTDVWSFGILMWEIVTLGSTPYANMGAREVMRRVREGYRLDRPVHCHQEFFRVIQRCWHSEPAKRPTFAELKHELGQLLGDSEHGGGYVDLEGLAEEIKHHNNSGASTLQRPHNH